MDLNQLETPRLTQAAQRGEFGVEGDASAFRFKFSDPVCHLSTHVYNCTHVPPSIVCLLLQFNQSKFEVNMYTNTFSVVQCPGHSRHRMEPLKLKCCSGDTCSQSVAWAQALLHVYSAAKYMV